MVPYFSSRAGGKPIFEKPICFRINDFNPLEKMIPESKIQSPTTEKVPYLTVRIYPLKK